MAGAFTVPVGGDVMARGGFTDRVVITVDEAQVLDVLFRLDIATSQPGFKSWADTEIDPWLQMRAGSRFASEGDNASGAWRPLSAFTQEWRAEAGFPPDHPINVRTGALRDFVTHQASGDWLSKGAEGGEYVWPGAALPVAIAGKLHTANVGRAAGENRRFPRSSTPPRPVVAADETDLQSLLMSYAHYVEMFVGGGADSITVSGVFGGSIAAPAVARGQLFTAGGGNFS